MADGERPYNHRGSDMAFAVSRTAHLRTLVILFVCTVVYAIFAMTTSRELIIPNMLPSTGGHIAGDPQYYHQLALSKVREIQDKGIQAFELRPAGQGPAGVASLLYLVWGNNPYSVVLLNATLHGCSAVLMSLILLQWFPLRTAIIATLPLVISPYMMFWFSQLNKDTFALIGILLFIYGFLHLIKIKRATWKVWSLLIVLTGILLMWTVRPYLNQILLPVSGVIFTVVLWMSFRGAVGNKNDVIAFAVCGAVVLISLGLMGKGAASDVTIDGFRHFEFQTQTQTQNQSIADECFTSVDGRNWQNAKFIPSYVNDKLRALMGQRCMMFSILETHDNVTTQRSFVDVSNHPAGSLEALAYLPRAALLGVFAPWPDYWDYVFKYNFSVFYVITPVEAAILYGGLLGLLCWLFRTRACSALTPIFISVSVMTVYGAATPFIGALYRYRYPLWMLLICMGIAALLTLAKSDWKK
jgi:putative peptidoglycan lipid II flippase